MSVFQKRFLKVAKHYAALKEYKSFIDKLDFSFGIDEYEALNVSQRAVLEAYLKRFASLQDYLGAKIFGMLLDMAGR